MRSAAYFLISLALAGCSRGGLQGVWQAGVAGAQTITIEFRSDGSVLENGNNFSNTWKGNSIYCDLKAMESRNVDATIEILSTFGKERLDVHWVDADHFDLILPKGAFLNNPETKVGFSRAKGR